VWFPASLTQGTRAAAEVQGPSSFCKERSKSAGTKDLVGSVGWSGADRV